MQKKGLGAENLLPATMLCHQLLAGLLENQPGLS
jgi:hypothetical protein